MVDSPYPGLRAFEQTESHIFFGREQALSDMIEKLRRRHFLAVTGPSGCGKSSLIKAGLLEELNSGFLSGEGPWRTVIFRPGNRPMRSLAEALANAFDRSRDNPALLEARLSSQEDALAEWLSVINAENETLFLVVDQFEEIFRFENIEFNDTRANGQREEVEEFVETLLRAAETKSRSIYIIITMRVDFLGDCATVPGLIEAINDSHFLTPRMTRLQCADAIREPARVFGGEVEQELVTEMLNDLSLADGDTSSSEWTNPDLLPLLQNVLARMWRQAQGRQGVRLTRAHYKNVGRLTGALNAALDGIYNELTLADKKLAERIFKLLVQPEASHRQRDVRRPTSVADIITATNSDAKSVERVIEAFRAEGRNFLMPPPSVRLTPAHIIDISHESLIRQWERLRQWVREEQRSADIYRQLENHARNSADEGGELLTDRQLAIFEPWWEEAAPTATWASRYGVDHADAFEFYRLSIARREDRREQEKKALEAEILKKQRWQAMARRFTPYAAGILAVLLGIFGVILYNADQRSKIERSIAAADRATSLVRAGLPLAALNEIRLVLPQSLGGTRFLWPYEPRVEAALYLTLHALRSEWLLPGHRDTINAADIAEDAGLMATASADGFARLWNLRSSERLSAWAHPNLASVVDVALSNGPIRQDDHWLATIDRDGVARIWSVASRTPLAVLTTFEARAATFSLDGQRLYVMREDGAIDVYVTERIAPEARAANPDRTLNYGRIGERLQATASSYDRSWRIVAAPTSGTNGATGETLLVSSPSNGALALRIELSPHPIIVDESRLRGGHGPADISPDGSTAAVVDQGNIEIWDLPSERRLHTFSPEGRVSALAFSVDGARLLVATDVALQAFDRNGDNGTAIATSADLRRLRTLATTAAGPRGSRTGWNVVIGEEEGKIGVYSPEETSSFLARLGDQQITAAAVSQNGSFAVIASRDAALNHTMRVVNTQTGEVVRTLGGHAGGWRISQFSRDGARVFSVSPDNHVFVTRARTGELLGAFTVNGDVLAIAEATGGSLLVAYTPAGIEAPAVHLAEHTLGASNPIAQQSFPGTFRGLWTSPNGQYFLFAVNAPNNSTFGLTRGLAPIPNGQFSITDPLLTSPFSGQSRWGMALSAGPSRTPIVLDLVRGARPDLPGGAASALFASPNDQYLALAQPAGVRLLIAGPDGALNVLIDRSLPEQQIDGQFSSDSRRLITVDQRGSTTRFDIGTTQSETRESNSQGTFSRGFLFTNDLSYGASIDNQRLRIFEVTSGRVVSEIVGVCNGTLTDFRTNRRTPDAAVIDCAGSNSQVVQSWDLGSRTLIGTTPWASASPGARTISNNGTVLVGSAALVMQRNGSTLTPLYGLPSNAPRNGEVTELAISPGGSRVASYGSDQYLRIWGPNGAEIDAISIAANEIRFLRFASENRIVMATGDGSIRVWSIEPNGVTETGAARQSNLYVAALSSSGSLLATGSTRGEVCVWRLDDLRRNDDESGGACNASSRFELANGQPVQVVGFATNDEVIAVGQDGGTARSASGGQLRRNEVGANDNVVLGGAVNPVSGRVILTRLDGATLATPETGEETRLSEELARDLAPRFVAGGRMILTPMKDGTVHLIESSGGGLVTVLGRRGSTPQVMHEAGSDSVLLIYNGDVLLERVPGVELTSSEPGRYLVGSSLRAELDRYLGVNQQ